MKRYIEIRINGTLARRQIASNPGDMGAEEEIGHAIRGALDSVFGDICIAEIVAILAHAISCRDVNEDSEFHPVVSAAEKHIKEYEELYPASESEQ